MAVATHNIVISITPVRTMLPADSRSREDSRTRIASMPKVRRKPCEQAQIGEDGAELSQFFASEVACQ